MTKGIKIPNSPKGILILWAPARSMGAITKAKTENSLKALGRTYGEMSWLLPLSHSGDLNRLLDKKHEQIREFWIQILKQGRVLDLVIVAGSEAPMILELLVFDAARFKVPVWNFAQAESTLDRCLDEFYRQQILA